MTIQLNEIDSFSDKETWDLICSGRTKGVFQLESLLGQSWAKRANPRNIEELADLISIIRPGCISGNTKILTEISIRKSSGFQNNRKKVSMKELYNNWTNDRSIKTIISYDENSDEFIKNEILNVFYTGIRPVYKVKIKRFIGKSADFTWNDLECTDDHKILTNKGWKELKDLQIGDRIAIVKRLGTRKAEKLFSGQRYFRQICFENYEYNCILCDWKLGSLDVNHIEGNRTNNNSPENLCFMCPNHHRLYSENKISKQEVIEKRQQYKLDIKKSITWVEYDGKEYIGDIEVYDISMKSPHHNFIAGNVVVHNCLEAMLDGKSMTKHYTDRKAGTDETVYLHPALEVVLKQTYGIIVYQEQAMRIATEIAGFSPEEADSLRKAMGKKDAALMKEVREKFVNGSKNKGIVGDSDAAQIFDWIQASARYSFNKSHAIAYAINSFRSAYCKAHDPIKFYEVYLNNACNKPDKQKEIKQLITDARIFGIEVYPPRLKHFHKAFTLNRKDSVIYFGYSNVKNVGEGEQEKLATVIGDAEKSLEKKISDFNWMECLLYIGNKIKKNAFISIISVGGLNGTNNSKTRNSMIFEFKVWDSLSEKEQTWIIDNYQNFKYQDLQEAVKDMINNNVKINSRRMKSVLDIYNGLVNPAYSLEDSIEWISDIEEKLMGYSLSCTKIDSLKKNESDVSCREISKREAQLGGATIAIKLTECKEYKIKNGDKAGEIMGFLSGEDFTGECNSFVIFPKEFSKFKKLLFIGNTVLLYGEVKEKGKDLSFIVNNVKQV